MKRRWQEKRDAEGKDKTKPNIIMGTYISEQLLPSYLATNWDHVSSFGSRKASLFVKTVFSLG